MFKLMQILLLISICTFILFIDSSYSYSANPNIPWTPWLNAGERVWGATLRLKPELKEVIGDGQHVAVATVDLNHDGQNEILLYFWDPHECGVDGCSYVVLTTNGIIKRAYTARVLKQEGSGLNVDGRYYPL